MSPQIEHRTPMEITDEQLVAVVAYTGLNLSAERLAEKADEYHAVLTLIRQASVSGLGETPPAIGFHASWT